MENPLKVIPSVWSLCVVVHELILSMMIVPGNKDREFWDNITQHQPRAMPTGVESKNSLPTSGSEPKFSILGADDDDVDRYKSWLSASCKIVAHAHVLVCPIRSKADSQLDDLEALIGSSTSDSKHHTQNTSLDDEDLLLAELSKELDALPANNSMDDDASLDHASLDMSLDVNASAANQSMDELDFDIDNLLAEELDSSTTEFSAGASGVNISSTSTTYDDDDALLAALEKELA